MQLDLSLNWEKNINGFHHYPRDEQYDFLKAAAIFIGFCDISYDFASVQFTKMSEFCINTKHKGHSICEM